MRIDSAAGFKESEVLLYDLGNRPASFDFVTCIASAVTHGVKHVRFVYGQWKPKDYTIEQAVRRYEDIVEPAVSLWGLTYSIGERYGVEYNHVLAFALQTYNKFGRLARIPVNVRRGDYVTVTLRRSRNPERDSKEEEWRKFAKNCDRRVVILKDGEQFPLPLADRMRLYSGAFLNMMVINGPLTLCLHSEAPFVSMRTIGCEKSNSTSPKMITKLAGITPGFQYPWQLPTQKLSYLDDTAENIEHEYREFCNAAEERKAA